VSHHHSPAAPDSLLELRIASQSLALMIERCKMSDRKKNGKNDDEKFCFEITPKYLYPSVSLTESAAKKKEKKYFHLRIQCEAHIERQHSTLIHIKYVKHPGRLLKHASTSFNQSAEAAA
jgi:hypothetical protein